MCRGILQDFDVIIEEELQSVVQGVSEGKKTNEGEQYCLHSLAGGSGKILRL
jgi:hypothetical protein